MIKQKAYVLHVRSYKETSALVDLITPDYGLIRCMARGMKRNLMQGQSLQPFVNYSIFFSGDSDLKNLDRYESLSLPLALKGDALFSGFYVNEIILRALRSQIEIEDEALFDAYEASLVSLNSDDLEQSLRQFELTVLEHMGQNYQWEVDFKTGEVVAETSYYGFFVEQGMTQVSQAYVNSNPNGCFLGGDLINLSHLDFSASSTLKMSKRLLRLAIRPIIGYKPIQARELLKQYKGLSSS
ncbi:MAG: DNA repair protein RecO (recombination protein O) [Psychrobacter glaciei]|jgi:DNA repair protein RecO (recombination protein O)